MKILIIGNGECIKSMTRLIAEVASGSDLILPIDGMSEFEKLMSQPSLDLFDKSFVMVMPRVSTDLLLAVYRAGFTFFQPVPAILGRNVARGLMRMHIDALFDTKVLCALPSQVVGLYDSKRTVVFTAGSLYNDISHLDEKLIAAITREVKQYSINMGTIYFIGDRFLILPVINSELMQESHLRFILKEMEG